MSFNRRFRNGLAFGTNYTLGLSLKGNTGLQQRLQHAADGTISVRDDQAAYEKLNENLALQRHVIKSYRGVGSCRTSHGDHRAVAAAVMLNDWQLSGVLTAGSASAGALRQRRAQQPDQRPYDITYTYQNNGTNVNLTGSPDYAAKIVYVGDPGIGLLGQPVRAVQHGGGRPGRLRQRRPGVGPEHPLGGCPDHTVDLAIARNIRLGGDRKLQFRLDAFNAFNARDLQRPRTRRASTGARRI